MTKQFSNRTSALLVVLVIALGLAVAFMVQSASAAGTMSRVQRVYHPCDLNKNTMTARGTGSTEDLCLRVWGHSAYTVSDRHGVYQESPAGAAVVTDLIEQARGEGSGYLREGLKNEIDMYGKRDR
jgi:hypothetical protein